MKDGDIMLLESVCVDGFRTISEKCSLNVDPKITVLMGANESGKTNLLHAIKYFNFNENIQLSDITKTDTTRWRKKIYPIIELMFSLDKNDIEKVNDIIPKHIESNKIIIQKKFNGTINKYTIKISAKLKRVIYNSKIEELKSEIKSEQIKLKKMNRSVNTLNVNLIKHNSELETKPNPSDLQKIRRRIRRTERNIKQRNNEKTELIIELTSKMDVIKDIENDIANLKDEIINIGDEQIKQLFNLLPEIIYIDRIEYITDQIPIPEIINRNSYRAIAIGNLLKIGGVNDYDTLNENMNRVRINLERASELITEKFLKVWKQEPIEISLYKEGNNINIEFKENISIASPPEERSQGFQWFISFFTNYIINNEDMKKKIILLDEPALQLHPRGQKDFVQILEDIANNNQIIYTSHSPFLINRNYPDRIRLIHKKENIGTTIMNKPYTDGKRRCWEPLKSAIGICLGDLFSFGETNIIVEGYSDKILMSFVSNQFAKLGLEHIDLNTHTIYPADGAGNTPYMVKFAFDSGLNPLAVIDADENGIKAKTVIEENLPDFNKIIMLSEILSTAKTIEDLLPVEKYVESVNSYYSNVSMGKYEKIDYKLLEKIPWKEIGIVKPIKDHLKKYEHKLNKNMVIKEYFKLFTITNESIEEYEPFKHLIRKIITLL
ncbi:MAG: AAA family ATPase [Candidatus Bathyarchaeota archaeon]|nr:AAA family ATPase [Candidatus Bathyarchaeota archaeon]